ncbi:MAG: hypothetical protein ACREQE_02170 [Candidatus Binataceae bacterium]
MRPEHLAALNGSGADGQRHGAITEDTSYLGHVARTRALFIQPASSYDSSKPVYQGLVMGLIESTVPGSVVRITDPCARCKTAEGVWSVAWPDVPADAFHLLCTRCMWRKFHEIKGPVRGALIRRVFLRAIPPSPR